MHSISFGELCAALLLCHCATGKPSTDLLFWLQIKGNLQCFMGPLYSPASTFPHLFLFPSLLSRFPLPPLLTLFPLLAEFVFHSSGAHEVQCDHAAGGWREGDDGLSLDESRSIWPTHVTLHSCLQAGRAEQHPSVLEPGFLHSGRHHPSVESTSQETLETS